jgi:hypothetical protein
MRTTHHKSHGRSRRKKVDAKVSHDFGSVRARLATITMIPLRVQGNPRARLEALAKQAEIDLEQTEGDQDAVPVPIEPTSLDKVTMPMAGPGKVRARPATLMTIPLTPRVNDLVKPTTFTNALILTAKLTKGTTSSTTCPGVPGRRPRQGCGNARVSPTMLAMKSMMCTCTHSNATGLPLIPRFKSMTGEQYDHGRGLNLYSFQKVDSDEPGLHSS